MKIRAGIIGASGYTGYELIKILSKMPEVELIVINSESSANMKVKELYKDFDGEHVYTNYSIAEINKMSTDIVFLAMPNGEAMRLVPKLKCRIIDLSADYRFNDTTTFESVYKMNHSDKGRKAVYGLPELFVDEIKKARLIANPGCYSTASLLGIYPVQEYADYIVLDCKSGYSGAGKKPSYVNEPKNYTDNIIPYNLVNHRHKAEIEQFIKTRISFTPHVLSTFRGLMCTAHILLKKKISPEKVRKLYIDFYKNKSFVRVLDKIPDLHDVQRTNLCCIGGFEIDSNNQLVVISVIDNLIKGASGQAVQNMNIMFGIEQSNGLE